jgi:hypothetical protein
MITTTTTRTAKTEAKSGTKQKKNGCTTNNCLKTGAETRHNKNSPSTDLKLGDQADTYSLPPIELRLS